MVWLCCFVSLKSRNSPERHWRFGCTRAKYGAVYLWASTSVSTPGQCSPPTAEKLASFLHRLCSLPITILYIIHRLSSFKENGISATGLCHRHQMGPTQMGTIGRLHPKIETESLPRNVEYSIDDRKMDNIQDCDSYINIPSSQTYRVH
jgi:hypothetical protein